MNICMKIELNGWRKGMMKVGWNFQMIMILIQNILYPIYIQEDFADLTGHGYPEYRWKTSSSVSAWEGYRGTIADASYENSTARTSYLNPGDSTYYYDRYGAGAYTTNAIYYFIMNIGTSSNFIR